MDDTSVFNYFDKSFVNKRKLSPSKYIPSLKLENVYSNKLYNKHPLDSYPWANKYYLNSWFPKLINLKKAEGVDLSYVLRYIMIRVLEMWLELDYFRMAFGLKKL